jgi:hypothetical protein
MPTYRNRAQLISNSTYTYWNASDLDTDMSEHPGSPNPALYQDFVIMFEIVSGGASLPTSSSDNFDLLVPDGSGGWQTANRKIGTTDYNEAEWTVIETIDPSTTYTVTQAGNALTIEIVQTVTSSQYIDLKKRMDMPNFLVFGHVAMSASNVGFHLGAYPESNNYTRDLVYCAASASNAVNTATKRNGSESYPYYGGTTKTTGFWVGVSKSGDALGSMIGQSVTESVSPKIDLQDWQNINRNNIQYNTTSYQYRTGSTGKYDALTQDYFLSINASTPAAAGTYSVTFSYLEQFCL